MSRGLKETIKTVGVILLSILAFSLIVKTVSAKDVPIGLIEYGITAKNICNLIKDGDKVVIDSPGGSVSDAFSISDCIRKKDVTVEVRNAMSSATFLVLASKKTCFNTTATIGFHSPFRLDHNGAVEVYGINGLRRYGHYMYKELKGWGYTNSESYTVIGITMLTPTSGINIIDYNSMVKLLGSRYIGECTND